ncbi:endonuclease domain-containing protein [Candidatus Acetothermia bacterium]|nr:endonuclease domain-containing protein [Candidatus Acetothermia bacterium]MCI2436954.1 endonuclease domain-containing protein [Candidatus Acetothermia bacterium]
MIIEALALSLKPHGLKAEREYRLSMDTLPPDLARGVYIAPYKEKTPEKKRKLFPVPPKDSFVVDLYKDVDPQADPRIWDTCSYDFLKPYTVRGFAIQMKRFYSFMMEECESVSWTRGCGLRVRGQNVDSYGNVLFEDYCPVKRQPCSLLVPNIEWNRDTCPAWQEYRDFCETDIEFSFLKEYLEQSRLEDDTPMLIPQVWIEPKGALGYDKRFRVDFAMFVRDANGAWRRYAIEIKGEKHHSGKEKLVEDAQRERALQYMGYHVISFWEPEVNRSRYKVVKELFTLANL